jgi:fido (protein-threonine AMPylation protein)
VTDRDLAQLDKDVRRGDWSHLVSRCVVGPGASPSDAALLAQARALARFNVAAQRAAAAWRRSSNLVPPLRSRADRVAWLAMERLRAAVDGKVLNARQLLAQELDDQAPEPDARHVSVPPYDVIDFVTRRVPPAAELRVRGVGRPLPDDRLGLGDPGSIFTLGLVGFPVSRFERGRPLDLVGSWDPASATFEVHRVVRLGLWPGHRVLLNTLGIGENAEEFSPSPQTVSAPGERSHPSRNLVAESLALGEAVAILDRAATASGVSFSTLGEVHQLLAPAAAQAGHLRSAPATVRLGDTPFYHAPPPRIARLQVRSLLLWLRRTSLTVHPLPRAAEAWARLTSAHPYSDGNGRVARALATWVLTAAGYRPLGAKDLREYVYQHGVEYYHRLHWWESERFLWYQLCADAVLPVFAPPSQP